MVFLTLFKSNFQRSIRDGFAIGYNVIFPFILIIVLGYLMKDNFSYIISSFQYYSVVTLPFCILFFIITSAYGGKIDASFGTAIRIIQAPVTRLHIIVSKLLSNTVVYSLCNVLVLSACNLMFKLQLSGKLGVIFLLLTSETFFCCALGLLIGMGMKNFIMVKNIINIPIFLLAVMGGSFFPLGSFNPFWQFIYKLSPVTWINGSLFRYLYDGEKYRYQLYQLTFVFFVAGIVISLAAVVTFKKEEFLHGNLPGYDK